MAEPRNSDFVQSLERGLSVIRAFDEDHRELTLSDVARATGLTRAAARRLLLTLVKLGYVHLDNGRFSLRAAACSSSASPICRPSACPRWAQPHLEALVAKVNESSSISVLDDMDVVYVVRVPTRRIMSITLAVGTRLPCVRHLMGRVLLGEPVAGRAGRSGWPGSTSEPLTRAHGGRTWMRCVRRSTGSAGRASRSPTRSWRRGCARPPCRSGMPPARSSPRSTCPCTRAARACSRCAPTSSPRAQETAVAIEAELRTSGLRVPTLR